MKPLQRTLAIAALLTVVIQTVRHGYLLWFEPRGSVLDRYDQPLKGQVAAASLPELLSRYDQVRKEVDRAKQEAASAGKQVSDQNQYELEPYKSERMLRDAITDWEAKSKEIREVRFYWIVGLALFVIGILTYVKLNRWTGLTLVIAAFSEFIYWTSPTFLGNSREFTRLLGNKLALSLLTMILLALAIRILRIFNGQTANE